MAGKFSAFYKNLNSAQREAVDNIEGPVMVVAGPGTGKTQILTLRIANIIRKTDTAPENILALTFTESGAASMRRRLAEVIGSRAYSVVISTFHGFANEVIKNYPEEFPRIIGATNITEVEQIGLIEELIQALPLVVLRPLGDPLYYVRAVAASINELKREGISPVRFSEIINDEDKSFGKIPDRYYEKGVHQGKMKGKYQEWERQIKKNHELAKVYEAYCARLVTAKRYDFADMILELLAALQNNPDLRLTLQEHHQYVLVDEHQDTNNAQNKILEILVGFHANPNIFVVGDEKQAIFRFQGASLENFLYFKKLYPAAKLVTLEHSYRSTQIILDSAERLLSGAKPLKAQKNYPEQPIELFAFSQPEVENYFLAKSIGQKIAAGTSPSAIAVLYRDNRDAPPLIAALDRAGLPFSVESDQGVFDDPEIKKLIKLLKAVDRFGDDEALFEALHVDFLGLPPLDIYKLIRARSGRTIGGFDLIAQPAVLAELGLAAAESIFEFYRKLSRWRTVQKNQGLLDLFETISRESGLIAAMLKNPKAPEKLDKLGLVFDEAAGLIERHRPTTLRDFLNYLDTLEQHAILIKKTVASHLTTRVRLMTAHRSKGQEFDYVYIVKAFDGHWGNRRRAKLIKLPARVYALMSEKIEAGDDLADERRLFYVAVTRARKGVIITYAKESAAKRAQLPTQFVEEIRSEMLREADPGAAEAAFAADKAWRFAPKKIAPADFRDAEFIKGLFFDRGLSVTALNNYLQCPWRYFYDNLLRLPKAPARHQLYGIAIHAALKDFFDAFRERFKSTEIPGKEFLTARFDYHLNLQPLTADDFAAAQKQGRAALAGYHDAYADRRLINTLTEFKIGGLMISPEIRLTGKIDKMEFIGNERTVNVVDYKTGQPKSRAFIEGATKNSDGGYKRQLVFYKLLLDQYEQGRYKMVSGDIDFVEPSEAGNYRKENFIIQDSEVAELRALILKVAAEITSGAFWSARCDRENCEYCALRALMT